MKTNKKVEIFTIKIHFLFVNTFCASISFLIGWKIWWHNHVCGFGWHHFAIWLTYLRGWFLNVGVKYIIYKGVPFQSFILKVKLYLGLWGRIGHFVGWRRISIKWWLRSVVTSFGWQILALGDTFLVTLVIPLWIKWWCNTVDQQFETFSLWWFVTFESKKYYRRSSIGLFIFGTQVLGWILSPKLWDANFESFYHQRIWSRIAVPLKWH